MDKGIDVDALKADAQKLLRLTIRIRKYQQFLNFIRQPKNWLAIAVNITLAVICAWSIRYGLSRPFVLKIFSVVVALGIIVILGSIASIADRYSSKAFGGTCLLVAILVGAIAGSITGAIHCSETNPSFVGGIVGGISGFSAGALISLLVLLCFFNTTKSVLNVLWEQYKKYCLPIILAILTFTVLLASSFQNVDAQSWKFDRRTGKLVERTVFIWPGSTIEREYFIVRQKSQKEIPVWIWFSAQGDSGWSYRRKNYSFRGTVVLTCNFKNYRAYQGIHGANFSETPLLAHSPEDAFERITQGVLNLTGLTSEDIEISTMDGLE